ncbi:RES domain-containing protein [Caulobacter sp. AP07]|uniref:RES family NAD+ phosphorylase n=1 Tax=Caulobacter sp. AP07 TaxID=1144304 RepID=UPI000271ED54|nr:RES family NAD+ phosphorylase [Caulobacter sp. AP07]EJL37554.1 RES domain-containing protein [Caulobacter sp. AP07]
MAQLEGGERASFPSWSSYWAFERSIRREARYVRTPEVEAFLASVLATADRRETTLKAGAGLWRAQLGHDWREVEVFGGGTESLPEPYRPERMKPLVGRAPDGRANSKGIPSLYLATTDETAMSEARPWLAASLTLAKFEVVRPLKLVDCSRHARKLPIYFEEPPASEREESVWTWIDRAFSEPMTRGDDVAEYAPTQVLAELFKQAGYDGVAYKSAFGAEKGFNIALFDLAAARVRSLQVKTVKAVRFEFAEEGEARRPTVEPLGPGA